MHPFHITTYYSNQGGGEPPYEFSEQYQAKLDRADVLGITKPSLEWQIREDQQVRAWVIDGKWDEADKLYMIANDGSKEFGEIELKNPATHRLTEVANGGALVWTSEEGTKSDGNAYYNAGFALSALTKYQIDNCFIGMVFFNPGQSNTGTTGSRSTSASRATMIPRNTSNNMSTIINSGTALNTAYTPGATYNYLSVKRDAGTQTNNGNGTTSSSAIAATSVPTANYFVLANNNAGAVVAGSQVTSSISFLVIGSKDLDGILSDVEDFFQ